MNMAARGRVGTEYIMAEVLRNRKTNRYPREARQTLEPLK